MPEQEINLQNVTYQVGDKTILDNISLSINRGEFIVILGPNGSGKTTLLHLILGLRKATSGSVSVFGKPVRTGSQAIGYSPQVKPFDPDIPITGRDYVRLGLHGSHWGIDLDSKKLDAQVEEALSQLDSSEIKTKKLGRLSGGEQQRLSLAQALVGDPELLLLDEPLANLDISRQSEILGKISRFHKKHNHTIVLVAHDVNPLLPYIDRVVYVANTHVTIGKPTEVITEPVLSKLFGVPVKVFDIQGRIFVAADDGIVH